VEKTKLVEVVPVAPAAVNPVMLLKAVILAELALVPPLATGRTPVTPVVRGKPVTLVRTPEAGVPRAGATKVLLLNVWARVVKANVSLTLAKLGMVKVVAPIVWEVNAMVANCPLVNSNGEAAEVATEAKETAEEVAILCGNEKVMFPVPADKTT